LSDESDEKLSKLPERVKAAAEAKSRQSVAPAAAASAAGPADVEMHSGVRCCCFCGFRWLCDYFNLIF